MPIININGNIRVNTSAGWAADSTVYSAKTLLVTTDATYGATDQRKFKIADGTQTWAQLDYFPVSGYDDATSSIQTQLNSRGYALQGSGNSITTVADATSYYFADPNVGTTTAADVVQMTIPKTGILKKAVIFARVAGTLASNEQSTMYFRLNSTTDVALSSVITLTATSQTFTSGDLSQAVTVGDTFAFKFTSATFATNPQTVSFTVSLFFEYA